MINPSDPDLLNPRENDEPDEAGGGTPGEQEGLRLIQAYRAIPSRKVRLAILGLIENVSRSMARRSRDP
jgi:hypothetical protein